MSYSKIQKLKEEFWDKYTDLFNDHSEAFELMRLVGVEQGDYIRKNKDAKRGK